MQKLYMQIPFRELHADLLKSPQEGGFEMANDSEGKVTIGQSMLQKLKTPYIKPMSMQHRVVCGCETCVSADTLQSSLNYWRLKSIKQMESITSNKSRN
jgi:hypothetical protein